MRELKFRQWHPAETVANTHLPANYNYWGYLDKNFPSHCMMPLSGDNIKPSEQYIGLEDENGKEIYESDIVAGYDGIAVIKYDDSTQGGGKFYPDFGENDSAWDWWGDKERWHKFKVVGNIHENPELLNG